MRVKCAYGKPLHPEATAIDITNGPPAECENDGVVPCELCQRRFCFEHAPQNCLECSRAICPECMYDHESNNYAHSEPVTKH